MIVGVSASPVVGSTLTTDEVFSLRPAPGSSLDLPTRPRIVYFSTGLVLVSSVGIGGRAPGPLLCWGCY